MAAKKKDRQVSIDSAKHKDKRKNIPTGELRESVKEVHTKSMMFFSEILNLKS